jgi:hypothetical protein
MSHSIASTADPVLIITTSLPARDDEPTIKMMTEPSPREDEAAFDLDEPTDVG